MIEPSIGDRLNSITNETLGPLVAKALGVDSAQVVDMCYEAVHGGMGQFDDLGMYRFCGQAEAENHERQWNLILKIIRAGAGYFGNDPSTWNYWKREALAYESGLLSDLPGRLTAPQCFAVQQLSENEIWIWLEAIPGEKSVDWPLDRYGVAARHLGQFNGAYLSDRSLPSHNWLSQGRIEEWLLEANPVIPELQNFLDLRLVNTWFTSEMAERTIGIWAQRQKLLDGIGQLPRTLCHHDAFRRNLVAGTDQDNQDITFGIDWAMLGSGAIGEEIATTFTVSLQFLDCEAQFAPQLEREIYEGYLAGLRDAGWKGQSELVRFGFTASAVLFMALGATGAWLPWLIEENGQKEIEGYLGQPIDKVLHQWSTMQAYLLDLGDESLALQEAIEWHS